MSTRTVRDLLLLRSHVLVVGSGRHFTVLLLGEVREDALE